MSVAGLEYVVGLDQAEGERFFGNSIEFADR
jgi:hypothetical protein